MVARGRIALWHYHTQRWNGQTAAETYEGPILQSLRRTWGRRASYLLVEDGDRKGNQSTKGLAAKKRSHIRTLTLPARTPELMPLDATLWKIIEDQVNDEAPEGTESKADFLARLKDVALELPRAVVKKAVARIPRVLRDIVASKGYHAKSD